MSAHRRIVAEAGLLGVVAVGVGIVRRRKHRIDDEVGEIIGPKRGDPGQSNARAVGITPRVRVVQNRKVGLEIEPPVVLIGEFNRDRVGAQGDGTVFIGEHSVIEGEAFAGTDEGRQGIVPGIADEIGDRLVEGARLAPTLPFFLWAVAESRGYASPYWMTFRQALELGAHVRKGESGSFSVFYSSARKTDTDRETGETTEKTIRFMKWNHVFNGAP